MRPTETQLDYLEKALARDVRTAVKALDSILLLEKTRETRRKGEYSDACAADEHKACRGDCDCECHTAWKGYAPNLPDNYQGIRNHPVGKTWHDNDATSDAALAPRRSREWLERFARVQTDLTWLAQQAAELAGPPVVICPCTRPITDTDRRKTAHGKEWHASCYQRHYRGRPLRSET